VSKTNSLFHTHDQAAAKLLSPKVSCVRGTTRVLSAAELRSWQPQSKKATRLMMSSADVPTPGHTTVAVTAALILRLLLEDQWRITELIRILVPLDRMKQKCFHTTTECNADYTPVVTKL